MPYNLLTSFRAALVAAVLIGSGPVLTASASATEAPPSDIDTGVQLPPLPQCFGATATIVMNGPGYQAGTSGNDVIVGSGGDDFIDGLGGRDRICAGGGIDRITADFDPWTGAWDPGIIVVGEGSNDDDFIDGQDDGDVIVPGAGDDHVWGSDGSDYLYGQDGDDTIFGGDKQDWMHCGEGEHDWADGGRGSNDWVNTDHGCETLTSAAPGGEGA